MRRLAIVIVAMTLACRSAARAPEPSPSPTPSAPQSGANSARAAVDGILAALRAEDVQAVSNIWGTARGPARDDTRFERLELERRIVLMTHCFSSDSYEVVRELPGENGGQGFEVALRRGPLTRRTRLNAVRSTESDRWYVDNLDVDSVKDFCQQRRPQQPSTSPGER